MKRHIVENRNEYNYLVKNNLINPNDDYVINDEGIIIVNGVEVGTPASSKPVINGEQGTVHITSNDGEIILSGKYENETSVRNTNIEIYDSGINLSTEDELAYTSIDSHNIVIGDGRLPRKSETEIKSDTILIGVGANAGNNIVVDGNFFVNGVQYISPAYVKESMEWCMNPETEELYRRPVVNLENNESNAKVKTDIICITNINAKYVNDNKDKFVTFLQDSLNWPKTNVEHILNEIPNTSDKTEIQFESVKTCDEILANTYKHNRTHNFDWRNGLKIDNKESSAEELIVRYNGSEIATKDDIKDGLVINGEQDSVDITATSGNIELIANVGDCTLIANDTTITSNNISLGHSVADSYENKSKINIEGELLVDGKNVLPISSIQEYGTVDYLNNVTPILNFENKGNGKYELLSFSVYAIDCDYINEHIDDYADFIYELNNGEEDGYSIIDNYLSIEGGEYRYNAPSYEDMERVKTFLKNFISDDENFNWRTGVNIENEFKSNKTLVVKYNGKEIATKEDVQALVDEIDTLKQAIRDLGGNI